MPFFSSSQGGGIIRGDDVLALVIGGLLGCRHGDSGLGVILVRCRGTLLVAGTHLGLGIGRGTCVGGMVIDQSGDASRHLTMGNTGRGLHPLDALVNAVVWLKGATLRTAHIYLTQLGPGNFFAQPGGGRHC